MKPSHQQLAEAYRREHALYIRIKGLVEEQVRIMETEPDPQAVLNLCGQVEELMAEIACIEQAIEPAKRHWEQDKNDPEGQLDRVLDAVETAIEQIALTQKRVQDALLGYMRVHRERTADARATISASRARSRYVAR